MARSLTALLAASLTLACAVPAHAYWSSASGLGTGSGLVATMPAGQQPTATASSSTVTVSIPQSTFLGSPLGGYSGGGYTLLRYTAAGTSPVTPGTSCNTTVSGSAATLTCTESSVPQGTWKYSVTPKLNTFTGAESTLSATVTVGPSAPTLTATAVNPAAGSEIGTINLSWTAVSGATSYQIFRRVAGGAFDYGSPGTTTATSGTDSYSLSGGTTYEYVVRAVTSGGLTSPDSNVASATAIARPSAPTGVSATAIAAAKVQVSWSTVSGAAGYNVYRKVSGGSYGTTPVNGSTPVSTTSLQDSPGAGTFVYKVRAVITGAGAAQVESDDSADSSAVTTDGTVPANPTGLTVTRSTGAQTISTAICGLPASTILLNAAGASSVAVTSTFAAADTDRSAVYTATSGAVTVTKTATGTATSNAATMDLSTLPAGNVTFSVVGRDAAGNVSVTPKAPTVQITLDLTSALTNLVYVNGTPDKVTGNADCSATVTATRTSGTTTTHSGTAATSSPFAFSLSLDTNLLTATYSVTAKDLAGNVSSAQSISG